MFFLAFDFWEQMVENDTIIAYVAILGGVTIAIVAIVFGSVKAMVVHRAKEATKREIAAYVAEELDPDKAVAMLEAGSSGDEDA